MKRSEGEPTPERRKDRVRLSVRDPFIETALASISIQDFNIDATRAWGNSRLAEARLFLMDRPAEEGRRLSPREAQIMLGRKLAELVVQKSREGGK